MSSPSRPSGSRRPLHNFKLPSHLKWSTKSHSSSSNSTRRGGLLPRSSSSSRQHTPTLQDKSTSLSQSTVQGSVPLRFKFSISSSNSQAPSSFSYSAIDSSFSPQSTSISTGLNVVNKETNTINYLLESGYGAGSFDEQGLIENMQVDSSLKMMAENFDKLLSVSDMNDKDQQEKDSKEMKMEKKPFKKFVSTNKKKLREVKDIPPVVALENKESTFWSLQPKMHSEKNQNLNLEKIVGCSYGHQGKAIQENKGKQIKATGKSQQGIINEKKTNEHEKEKMMNKETKPMREQRTEIKLPKFSRQLTPQEIADDIFYMTGSRPSTKPKRRTKNIQKNADQVTPGLWLGSIGVERYAVRQNVGKGK